MALPRGTRLGPYEIGALIGAGGMGEVYRARDTRLDRAVAIKILHEGTGSSERRSRFEREARAIAALTHPHICTVYDVGHHEGVGVAVQTGSAFVPGAARTLVETRITSWERSNHSSQYAVTADGERFLVNTATDTTLPITLVLNWTAALKK
jgi:serine/threonine protein kinase